MDKIVGVHGIDIVGMNIEAGSTDDNADFPSFAFAAALGLEQVKDQPH